MHAFHDDGARSDETAVFNDDGTRAGRLQDAADADAAGQVDVAADLRTRSDGGPRVDHRARTDPSADVDIAGHQDDAGLQKAAIARDAGRHHAHLLPGQIVLERNLVVELERSHFMHGHRRDAEVQQNRFFDPRVNDPAVRGRLRDANLAAVERGDGVQDGFHVAPLRQQGAVGIGGRDEFCELHDYGAAGDGAAAGAAGAAGAFGAAA